MQKHEQKDPKVNYEVVGQYVTESDNTASAVQDVVEVRKLSGRMMLSKSHQTWWIGTTVAPSI